jgi:hypothetical protein
MSLLLLVAKPSTPPLKDKDIPVLITASPLQQPPARPRNLFLSLANTL